MSCPGKKGRNKNRREQMLRRKVSGGLQIGNQFPRAPSAKRVIRAHLRSAWCLTYGKLKSLSVFHNFVPLIMYIV